MRVQFFAFCQRYEQVQNGGQNLYDVAGELNITGRWSGSLTPPPLPFKTNLVVGFIESSEGEHRAWLVVQPPGDVEPKSTAEAIFKWPTNSATHTFRFQLDMAVTPITGVWEFHIFVDNEPLGVALLPIRFNVHRET